MPPTAFAAPSSSTPMRSRFYAARLPPLHPRPAPPRRPRPRSRCPRHDNLTAVAPAAASPAPPDRSCHSAATPYAPHDPHAPHAPSVPPTMTPHSDPPYLSFASFFTANFHENYPSIAPLLHDGQLALAASVYLFRFSHDLSPEFVHATLDAVARSIAEVTGKSIAESRRLFRAAAKAASHIYFARAWDKTSAFVTANTPSLLDIQKRSRKLSVLTESLQVSPTVVREVDPALLQALLDTNYPVLVFVFADYCSVCKATRTVFDDAARLAEGAACFVTLNGPRSPQFKLYYNVSSYPALLRFQGRNDVVTFQTGKAITPESIVAFAKGSSSDVSSPARLGDLSIPDHEGEPDMSAELDAALAAGTPAPTFQWASVLRQQGIDELDALVMKRDSVLNLNIDNSCNERSCLAYDVPTHSATANDPPPLCVLLGGGMGAGKTTAVNLIVETPFWKKYGRGTVMVEADAFKLNDPLFHVLPNRVVHHDSIIAAEELFLKAVNSRRDVVFDGTLSWSEYARQTIDMLRDIEYIYERGPGYSKSAAGGITEVYWVRAEKRKEPVAPYCIELVAVTADAEISVIRGIVRMITSGRGVPIPDQIHSHVLFSKSFEEYVDLVDSVYLFDTTLNSSSIEENLNYEEQLVAIKPGILFQHPTDFDGTLDESDDFIVRNTEAYARFLRKRKLNTMASNTAELYLAPSAEL